MPMIDVTIPEGALKPEVEDRLMTELTNILIRAEGYSSDNQVAQHATWLFLHRPARAYRAGQPSEPLYRIVPSVPEGQYTDAARASLVKDVTDAVVRAIGGKFEDLARQIWVFPTEIPDGQWAGRGRIQRLPEIHARLSSGEPGHKGGQDESKVGAERVARRRREKARELLDAFQQGTTAD